MQGAFIAAVALLAALARPVSLQSVEYKWAYRNPLSITDSSAVDLGEGSYNGTVNSVRNVASADTPVLEYSHGGTMAFLPNGSLAVIWQGSPLWWEGNFEQAVYWALSNDAGETFGPATRVFGLQQGPLWGPSLHVQNGTIYMFFSGRAPAGCVYQGEGGLAYPPGGDLQMTTSVNNGVTWSTPQILVPVDDNGFSAKLNIGRVAVNSRGDWLLPFWRERSGPNCWGTRAASQNGVPGVLQSPDMGRTWTVSTDTLSPAPGTPPTQWLIENIITRYINASAATYPPNAYSLLQTFRSNSTNVWQSWSFDDGAHWTQPKPGSLRSPNSKSDTTMLPDGSIVVAYNNASSLRTNLTVARSTDGGVSWQHIVTLENNPRAAYSYPTITYIPATGRLSVVYSVWQPPSNATSAFAPAPSQGGQYARQGGVQSSPTLQTAGRKLKGLHALGEGTASSEGRRGLLQVPYNIGAWGRVSYGIRMASIDITSIAGPGPPANPPAQPNPAQAATLG